jgi:hypothetical protein
VSCGTPVAAGERAGWESTARTVTCLRCLDTLPSQTLAGHATVTPTPLSLEAESVPPPLERGQAGRSVAREAHRWSNWHRERQEQRIAADRQLRADRQAEHPILGRAVNLLTPKVQIQPAPQHVRAWAIGAPGEQAVGESLEQIPGIVVLHDRHNPRSKANIDHIAVTPAGVWVIDAKVRAGKKLEYRDRGGIFSKDERLIVGGRDETKLVDDMTWQVQTVFEACGDLLGDTVVRPALCFVDATVGLLTRKPWKVRGVVIAWRAVLPEILTRPGPFETDDIDLVARQVAERLPSA